MPAHGAPRPTRRPDARPPIPSHFRHSYSKDKAQLMRRLSRMEGQVRGIARMIEREEYCVDILQQTAALRAAVDALSILVLEDHVQGCVRTAAERGEADQYVDEVIDVVRRTLGRPVREQRRPTGLTSGPYLRPGAAVPVGGMPGRTGRAHHRRRWMTDTRHVLPVAAPDVPAATADSSSAASTSRRDGGSRRPRGASAAGTRPRRPRRPTTRPRSALAGLLDLLAQTVGAERPPSSPMAPRAASPSPPSGPADRDAAIALATLARCGGSPESRAARGRAARARSPSPLRRDGRRSRDPSSVRPPRRRRPTSPQRRLRLPARSRPPATSPSASASASPVDAARPRATPPTRPRPPRRGGPRRWSPTPLATERELAGAARRREPSARRSSRPSPTSCGRR